MRSRSLGSTDITVSELGFGGSAIGNLYAAVDDETSTQAVDCAWEAGIRYFDTAPHYGLGLSERRLGAALASRPREQLVLSTKVGRLLEPNLRPTGSDRVAAGFDVPDDLVRRFDFSADGVRRSLDASLQRLGVDRVDVVLLHDPDNHVEQAVREALPALAELRGQGVVGAVGVGMNQWRAPMRMLDEGLLDVVMLAGRYTLLDRSGEPLLRACEQRGIAVLAAAPYGSGLLATPRPASDATYGYRPAGRSQVARANDLADRCERFGVELPTAALQFPLQHSTVVSVVAGLRSAEQVQAASRRLRRPVPQALWNDLAASASGADQ